MEIHDKAPQWLRRIQHERSVRLEDVAKVTRYIAQHPEREPAIRAEVERQVRSQRIDTEGT